MRLAKLCTSILVLLMTVPGTPAIAGEAEPGQNPWSRWDHLPQGKDFFPIGVWAQSPGHAAQYKAMGVNYYLALFGGPTAEMMTLLREAGMATICSFNEYARENLVNDSLVWGWMHGDEPDLAHVYPRNTLMGPDGMDILFKHWPDVYGKLRSEGKTYEGWGMGANPEIDIHTHYAEIKRVDPKRPVLVQLSNAVAYDGVRNSRGDHSGRVDLYPRYLRGADLISYDVYPVAGGKADQLWLVPHGLDNLRKWGAGDKPVMVILEAGFGETWADHAQQRAQAWMAINRGASSITWFCHRWATVDGQRRLTSTAMPITNEEVGKAVQAINEEIHGLAKAINSPNIPDAATVRPSNPEVPVEFTVKRVDGATYIFAVAMRPGETIAAFTVEGVDDDATVEVINEDRTLRIHDGSFIDRFQPDFDVNLYRIR